MLLVLEESTVDVVVQGVVPERADVHARYLRSFEYLELMRNGIIGNRIFEEKTKIKNYLSERPHESTIDAHELLVIHHVRFV